MAVSKDRKKKRRRKPHILLKILIFIGCAVGLYYFMTSDWFCITHVNVEGNRQYSEAEILSISGNPTGENVFEADLAGMQESLSRDCYIKTAVVERKLIHGIRIRVEEREPFAAILLTEPLPDGTEPAWIYVDEEEYPLSDRTGETPKLSVISGLKITEMTSGTGEDYIKVDKQTLFRQTMELIRRTRESGLYFKRIEISDAVITLYIYDTLTCVGTPENILNGLDALKEVLIDLTNKGVKEGIIRISGEATASYTPPAPVIDETEETQEMTETEDTIIH